jgi:hypothetical protein
MMANDMSTSERFNAPRAGRRDRRGRAGGWPAAWTSRAGLLLTCLGLLAPPLVWAGGIDGHSVASRRTPADDAALELGRRVLAVQRAIANPRAPDAMDAIVDLGTDSRYYVMVRGWLAMQLQGDTSILSAAGDRGGRPEIEARVAFLEAAIRAIDLE